MQAGATRPPRGVLPREVAAGLKLLYKELVQPNKALRCSFLQVRGHSRTALLCGMACAVAAALAWSSMVMLAVRM